MRLAETLWIGCAPLAFACSLRDLSELESRAGGDVDGLSRNAEQGPSSEPEPFVPPADAGVDESDSGAAPPCGVALGSARCKPPEPALCTSEADCQLVTDSGTAPLGEPRCDALQAEQCAAQGASCDVVASGTGTTSALCRWSAADSEELCTSQTPGRWITERSVFAIDHPGSISPSLDGACVAEPAASSSWTDVELCFEFEHDFLATGGDPPSQGAVDARGVRFLVTDDAEFEIGHDADPITGCKTVTLDTFGAYRVRVRSIAKLADGNEVRVLNDDVEAVNFGWTATPRLVPAALQDRSVSYTWPVNPPGNSTPNVSNVMAALATGFSGHALTTQQFYRVYLRGGPCAEPCVALDPKGNRAVYLNGNGADRFEMTRLFAELATIYRIGGAVGDRGGDPADCGLSDPAASSCANGPGHTAGSVEYPMGSEEYGNCAVSNGWAQYVATSVWNHNDRADCTLGGLSPFDGCDDTQSARTSCYGDAPQALDTGFERDWLSTFWALERLDGCAIPFSVIADIWASANPVAWTNADARSALLAAAPSHASGEALDCFVATLSGGIDH